MESRKLIRLGTNSYVVSLPTTWLKKNKLSKGNVVYFKENGNNEIVFRTELKDRQEVPKSVIINVDKMDLGEINRRINTAYINNFHTIIVKGKTLKNNAKEIRQILQDLMALEIMEQKADRIVAKDFLNMKQISIEKLIKRLDLIVRAMLVDTKVDINKAIFENIYTRDEDVNRMTFLLFRAVNYFMENPNVKPELTQAKLLELWQVTNYIEKVADETKRIAKFFTYMKLNSKQKKFFEDIISVMERDYFTIMTSYYNGDCGAAYKQSKIKKQIIIKCNNFLAKNHNVKWVPSVLERIKALNDHIHTIGRIVYQK